MRSSHDFAGRNAGAERDLVLRIAAQFAGRANSSQCIVLAGDGQPEDGGHPILINQVDRAAVALDRPTNDIDGAPIVRLDEFGIERVRRRSDHVGAQDGHDATTAAGGDWLELRPLPRRRATMATTPPPVAAPPGSGWRARAPGARGLDRGPARRPSSGGHPGTPRAPRLGDRRHTAPHEQAPQPLAAGLLGRGDGDRRWPPGLARGDP